MADKMPWMKWYSAKWLNDTRLLSIEARGLWIDMLMLMDQSPRRGYLQHASGKPITPEQLARLTGCSAELVSRLLRELEDSGTYSSSEHGIYNRRMLRDERIRQQNSENGRKGGNPSIRRRLSDTPTDNPNGGLNDASNTSNSESTKDSLKEKLDNPPSPLLVFGQFVEIWNSTLGVRRCREITPKRRKHFQARVSDEKWDWKAALAKFPLQCTIDNPNNWIPDIDWFLRPGNVTAILEGKYDWTPGGKTNASRVNAATGRESKYDDPNAGDF